MIFCECEKKVIYSSIQVLLELIIPIGLPFILNPKKALFFDLDKIFSLENSYSSSTVNKDKFAVEPSLNCIVSILNISLPFVKISIVSSVVNNEFNAPKKDSKPIVPNLALYISVFLFSISIGQ